MPKFVYQPEGAAAREWEWEPLKIPARDAELIETKTGMMFGDWMDATPRGSMRALHALLFVLLRKEAPGLQWDQVEFTMSEVGWKLSDDELVQRVLALSRKAQDGPLDEDEGVVLEAYRASLSAAQLEQVAADLRESAVDGDANEGGEDADPTSLPSAPESEPGAAKPAKKKS